MIEFISAPLGSGMLDKISERIATSVENCEKTFLIVPEQATLALEGRMSKILPASSPLFFEVTNFTRLANTVERTLGGLSAKPSDRPRRALVMWDAINELAPILKVLAPKCGISAALVNRAISAINEMEAYGIDAEEVRLAAENAKKTNRRLGDKLSDISVIMPLYKKMLFERYGDTGDELYKLLSLLDENPGYKLAEHIFIYGFTSFTEAQYRLISRLMDISSLTVCFDIPRADSEAFEYTEPRAARRRIKSIAQRKGHELKETRLSFSQNAKSPLLSEVSALLWHTNSEIDNDCLHHKDDLRIFEAKDPYEECDQIAADIRARVEKGASYSDIAVIARNTDRYTGILDNALIKCNIPHFISKPKDVSSFDAVKLIYSALGVISRGFELEDVITYAKSGLLGIDRGACDEFELYCETWKIEKHRFTDGKTWTMPLAGYSSKGDDSDKNALERINNTKEKITAPLLSLSADLKNASQVRDYATALVKFITGLGLEEKIEQKRKVLLSLREKEYAEEEGEILKLIYSSLDLLVSAAATSPADIDSFRSRLELVLSEAKLGRIPSNLDEVLIGDADALRTDGVKHVYLIGCNYGEFPATPTDASYFTDKDKLQLADFGINIEENTEFAYSKELFYFTRAFSSAENSVTLFYTAEDFSFHPLARAEVIDRIERLTGEKIKAVKVSDLPLSERIFDPDSAIELYSETMSEKLLSALLELGYADEIIRRNAAITNEALSLDAKTPEEIYKGALYLSQTRIDKFTDCPLSYYLSYTLKLSENEAASFDARNIGSFIHSIFENYFKERKRLEEEGASPEDINSEELTKDASREYISSLGAEGAGTKRLEHVIERLTSSAKFVVDTLADELKKTKYEPRFFELPIKDGAEGYPSASEFLTDSGHTVKVIGNIDRVDIYEGEGGIYVRVVDYKTGAKVFSPKDLDRGRNLQMFLYLKAIVESKDKKFLELVGADGGKRLIPAGVIYAKSEIGDVKLQHSDYEGWREVFENAQKREGMLLDDKESIEAMGGYTPVKFTASGAPTKSTADKLYTLDGWDRLMDKVDIAVKRVAEGITQGVITAKPMVTKRSIPCESCKFKPICRNAVTK